MAPPELVCVGFPGAVCWDDVPPLELCETTSGRATVQPTCFKTAWTPGHLHILFHCTDSEPWATLTKHDAPLYDEEVVEVFLDPFGDLETYYEIEVNPLNAVCDLVLRRNRSGYRKEFAWHCEGLRTQVATGAGFWRAEMVIPFASIVPEPPQAGEVWRGNFFRIDRPGRIGMELSAWSPTGFPKFHIQQKFGFIEFAASGNA
jgi:hypothetical protein